MVKILRLDKNSTLKFIALVIISLLLSACQPPVGKIKLTLISSEPLKINVPIKIRVKVSAKQGNKTLNVGGEDGSLTSTDTISPSCKGTRIFPSRTSIGVTCLVKFSSPGEHTMTVNYSQSGFSISKDIVLNIPVPNTPTPNPTSTPTPTPTFTPSPTPTDIPTATNTPGPIASASNMVFSANPSSLINPGTTVTLITYMSAESGVLEGSVTFTSSAGGGCNSVPISSEGVAGCVVGFLLPGTYTVSATFNSSNGEHLGSSEAFYITVEEEEVEEPVICEVDKPCP